jgi:VWFA-related protein
MSTSRQVPTALPKRKLRFLASSFVLYAGVAMAPILVVLYFANSAKALPQQIRVTSRIVTLNVVVKDAAGQPVTNLTKDDFKVLDGGQLQRIVYFSELTDVASPPKPQPPDTYTNILSTEGAPASVVVVLVDALNSRWTSQGFAANKIRDFLRKLRPEDHIGLYVLTDGGLAILHDFTQDSQELIAAIQRYDEADRDTNSSGKKTGLVGASGLDPLLQDKFTRWHWDVDGRAPGVETASAREEKNRETINSFMAIRDHLAGVRGRKSVVWLSDKAPGEMYESGLHVVPAGYQTNSEYIAQQFNDAGIAIYPVSAEGLKTVQPEEVFASVSAGEPPPTPNWEHHVYMLEAAHTTGGRAFFDRNDLDAAIQHALDDGRVSYSLAYYPNLSDWHGEFRKIKVTVDREGVAVLTRAGYATPEAPKSGSTPNPPALSGHQQTINRALRNPEIEPSPLDASTVPMTVHLDVTPGQGPTSLSASVNFDPRPMVERDAAGKARGLLQIYFMQLDEKGNFLDVTDESVNLDLSDATVDRAAKEGSTLTFNIKPMPGTKVLAVVLRDASSGSTGSVWIPFEAYADRLAQGK